MDVMEWIIGSAAFIALGISIGILAVLRVIFIHRRRTMTHFTCNDCQMGFQARSREEAEDEAERAAKTEDFNENAELVYARQCPYCGSFAIKER